MRPVDPRLLRYAAAARSFFVAGGVVAVVQTASVVAFAWLVTQLIVQAIGGASLSSLGLLLAGLGVVVVVRFVAAWLGEVNSARGAAVVKSELRRRVLGAVTRLGPSWLGARSSTAVGVTAGSGLDALDTYFSRYLPQLILTAIATPVLVAVIWWQDWVSGLTVLLTLPLIPVFMILIGWATQSVQRAQWEKLGRLSTAFLDVVGGLSTLIVYGRAGRQSARLRAVTAEYREQTMKVLRVSFLSGFALELAASLSVALVAVSIGVRLIDGSLVLSVGLFVLLLAPEAFLPLRAVGAQFHAAADGVAASTDVFDILDAAAALAAAVAGTHLQNEGVGALLQNEGAGARRAGGVGHPGGVSPTDSFVSGAAVPLETGGGGGAGARDVEVRGLGLRYGESSVFEGLDARLAAGRVTAVTGASGSGKSSLVGALLGFVPAAGRVLVGGRDATHDPVPRDWLSWSGQRASLLAGDVLANVALGDEHPDADRAREALDLVGG
ncbi:MAG: ABC transporter transmembrane domain-containing protein, partial [Herbiconiux sp.]|nr:ABC transporter transmembrane domain-containing protein [Herbiconiux sp.]